MDLDTFLSLLSQREYLPAVGLMLVVLVGGLRAGLPKLVPWFGTKVGGHAIGFGASTLLHLGVAFQADAGITPGLFASALGVGWASSGGWEAVRDLWVWNKDRKRPQIVGTPSTVPVLLASPPDAPPAAPGDAA